MEVSQGQSANWWEIIWRLQKCGLIEECKCLNNSVVDERSCTFSWSSSGPFMLYFSGFPLCGWEKLYLQDHKGYDISVCFHCVDERSSTFMLSYFIWFPLSMREAVPSWPFMLWYFIGFPKTIIMCLVIGTCVSLVLDQLYWYSSKPPSYTNIRLISVCPSLFYK